MNNKKGLILVISFFIIVFFCCLAFILFSENGENENGQSNILINNNSVINNNIIIPSNNTIIVNNDNTIRSNELLMLFKTINNHFTQLVYNNDQYGNNPYYSLNDMDYAAYFSVYYYINSVIKKENNGNKFYFINGFLSGIDASTYETFIGDKNLLLIENGGYYNLSILPQASDLTNYSLLYDMSRDSVDKKKAFKVTNNEGSKMDLYAYYVGYLHNIFMYKPQNAYLLLDSSYKESNNILSYEDFLVKQNDIYNLVSGSFKGINTQKDNEVLLSNGTHVIFYEKGVMDFTIDIQ